MRIPQNKKYSVGNMNGHELIEEGHNILICPIPKVSSTFWKEVLSVVGTNGTYSWPTETELLKEIKSKVLNRAQYYKDLKHMDNESELNLTTAFIFVRNPYARLYSGYIDKVYTPTGRCWIENWGKVANTIRNGSKDYEYDITFREFVQYILQLYKDNKTINAHFQPMTEICDACAIPYTFIGHLETFVDDAKYLIIRVWCNLQIRGYISKLSRFPFSKSEISTLTEERYMDAVINELGNRKDISAIKNQRTEAYIQAYQTIPLTVMRQLREYLLKDCTLFGYDDKPKELFDRNTLIVDHHYLDGL
ncbi:CHSTE-like protein [Mya arenaria]|uniref:Carbohydrate sulfotransferase n=1 Tax=Mya arenaria TaxID=6604 RepID=A0ABY7G6B2_MYAAR|nr:CHSTE-like protein [Mya arenaria]